MALIHHGFQCPSCLLPASGFHNSQLFSKFTPNFATTLFKTTKAKPLKCISLYADDDDEAYLVDAPVQVGDGFSFYGGNYSDAPTRADEWFKQGKFIKSNSISGGRAKAKDPIFGLAMGQASQVEEDGFRWFYVEAGNTSNPSIVLIHGLPSQAYSFRKVLSTLSQDYHVVAFDWLGFGFSDKPQPNNGFDYTFKDYKASFESLLDVLSISNVTLVCQGYFSPVIAAYAKSHQENLKNLILINPPLTEQHAKLPSILSSFSSFLLGEIFSQDPLRASDRLLTNCGPYLMDEEDAMVYRKPYLTSGASGFALTAVSRMLKKGLKDSIVEMRSTLSTKEWKVPTSIIWGMRDRWLKYNGVEEFAQYTKHEVIQLPKSAGMGNKELLENFKAFKPIKARQSYGPNGHRGISLLIFEDSPVGYLEADRLQKDFLKEGRGRADWDRRGILTHPAGGKRILYGYMAKKEDMENFNKHLGNGKAKYDMLSYKSKVIEPVKKMKEDSQKLEWLQTKMVEDKEVTKSLEEAVDAMATRLEIQKSEVKIIVEKVAEKFDEWKKGVDYLERIYKQQIDELMGDIEKRDKEIEKMEFAVPVVRAC